MPKWIALFVLAALAVAPAGAGAGQVPGPGRPAADGESTVAFDEDRMTVTDNQALPEPQAGDVDRPLLEELSRPSQRVLRVRPEELLRANENAGRRSESRLPVEPWLGALAKPPILTVYPSIQKGVEVREWRFSIMDDAGNTLWTKQEKGSIPPAVTWEGQTSKSGMIDVEMSFFYTLGALDRGGNPIFMSGPSQSLSAIAYPDGNRLVVRLSSGRLFRSSKDVVLSDEGENLLRESLNEISKRRYQSYQITVFSNNEKLADLQSETVIRYFMRQFTLPREVFTVARRIVNDRYKVEILCQP